jgi:putative salt-induced outer membrane protein YdiY
MPFSRTLPIFMTLSSALTIASAASAGEVELKNGDVLEGIITQENPDSVTIDHPVLGVLELDRANVGSVAVDEEDPVYVPEEVEGWFFPGWEKTLEAGFTGKDGNTESLNFYGLFNTDYEDETDRWDIRARYFLEYDDGDQNRNEGDVGVTRDWLLPERPYFTFAKLKYEHDRFTGWQHRYSGFYGFGYPFVDNGTTSLIGRLGAGGNYEAGDVNEFTPEALVGLELNHKITDNQKLTVYNTLYPALDPFLSEFRNVSGATYAIKLNSARGLSFKIGIENEYNSEVEPGTEKNDLKYFGALVYNF